MGATLTCFETSSGPVPYEGPHSIHENKSISEGMFDSIHQQVGSSVAKSLRDEQTQQRVASQVTGAAQNKEYQKHVGGLGMC